MRAIASWHAIYLYDHQQARLIVNFGPDSPDWPATERTQHMAKIRVVYRNDGHGNITILPIAESDMPACDRDSRNGPDWDRFFREITAQYGKPTDVQDGAFFGTAMARLYRSTANYWAVFGFDVRPGLDDHTIRFVRFAYRNTENNTMWAANPHPPIGWVPDIARAAVKSWGLLDSMPDF